MVEKIIDILQHNPHGLLLYRDELMGALSTWEKKGHESDRSFYLEAWNGYGSYTSDRIGRGTVHCSNTCVSILGSTQPTKLKSYFHKTIHNMENDGLIQRFQMLIYPDAMKDWQMIDQKPDQEAYQLAEKTIERIKEFDFMKRGAHQDGEQQTPYLRFSEQAQGVFNEWITDLCNKKMKEPGLSPLMVEHLSKYRKLMPALALIHHLVNTANDEKMGNVSLEAAKKSVAWCGFLESHARRIYHFASHHALDGAQVLASKIREGKLQDGFTVRDIYRNHWTLLDPQNAQMACDTLVKLCWLKEKSFPASFQQKEKTEYLINPLLRSHCDE